MRDFRIGKLYPITDTSGVGRPSHVALAGRLLEAGVRLLQIREKRLSDREFLEQLRQIRELCSVGGARFLVNDRVDLALASGADGVHLGQDDLPAREARKILGPKAVIGFSTHNEEQLRQAADLPIDYVAVGPVFATRTKKSGIPPLGVDFVRRARQLTRLPLVAIGGIDLERAVHVWAAGADSVAVISDIVDSPDPAERARQYRLRAGEEVQA